MAHGADAVRGRRVIVTGATSGIGFHTARGLAAAGAEVTLAVRSTDRGIRAESAIRAEHPAAALRVDTLDLADLSSIRTFAARWLDEHGAGPDVLVNNAGIISARRQVTRDGFETTIGTNHLGHFALTGLLIAGLSAAGDSSTEHARVITVTSLAAHVGRLQVRTWTPEPRSRVLMPWTSYAQSKFANALFSVELQRRVIAAGLPIDSILVHPGFAVTNVLIPGLSTPGSATTSSRIGALLGRRIVPSAEAAATCVRYAAGSPEVTGGMLVGPSGRFQIRGEPGILRLPGRAKDSRAGRELWQASERLTQVSYLD